MAGKIVAALMMIAPGDDYRALAQQGRWVKLSPFSFQRSPFTVPRPCPELIGAAAELTGKIYVLGGASVHPAEWDMRRTGIAFWQRGGARSTTGTRSPWLARLRRMLAARHGMSVAMIGNKLYVIDGSARDGDWGRGRRRGRE